MTSLAVRPSLSGASPHPSRPRAWSWWQAPRRLLAGLGVAAFLALLLAPSPAQAWWRHPYWGPRIAYHVVVPVPAYPVYGPPPIYRPYPPRVWVPAHYTPAGYFVPGHWQWR